MHDEDGDFRGSLKIKKMVLTDYDAVQKELILENFHG